MQKMNTSTETDVKRHFGVATMIGAIALAGMLFLASVSGKAGEPPAEPEVPVKGKVTMVDIGAKECIPCRMMAPILEELEKEYHDTGKAAIIFIDVWKNKAQGRKFGIRSIPTQIFYDKDGNEVYRHEGFMEKKAITGKLQSLGVK